MYEFNGTDSHEMRANWGWYRTRDRQSNGKRAGQRAACAKINIKELSAKLSQLIFTEPISNFCVKEIQLKL